MLKLGRVTKFKMLFLVLVFVFNFDLFKFSAAILEKGLLPTWQNFPEGGIWRKEPKLGKPLDKPLKVVYPLFGK